MKQMGKYFAVVFLTLFVWSVAAVSPTAVLAAKADKAAKESPVRHTHEEVFARVRKRISK